MEMIDKETISIIGNIIVLIIVLSIITNIIQLIANLIIIIKTPKKNNYEKELKEIKTIIEKNDREILYELRRIRKVVEK